MVWPQYLLENQSYLAIFLRWLANSMNSIMSSTIPPLVGAIVAREPPPGSAKLCRLSVKSDAVTSILIGQFEFPANSATKVHMFWWEWSLACLLVCLLLLPVIRRHDEEVFCTSFCPKWTHAAASWKNCIRFAKKS